jgi:putative colanic acid biosynthesis UDP-glucose lipid carrier transferase
MLHDVEAFHDAAKAQRLIGAGEWSSVHGPVAGAGPARLLTMKLQLACKRGFDIVASLTLLLLFSPLLLLVAIAIRLIDTGAVIYGQDRYGRFGVPFTVFKFRTMRCDEPGHDFVQVSRGDPRVTPLGALLRRSSLDELPQLLNVLAGDMSLVGPRPHPIAMDEQIFRDYPPATRRLAMRPGMTGLAQIRGLRGPTSDEQQLRARIDADIEYVEGWTLWRDVVVLAQTPRAWICGENAV